MSLINDALRKAKHSRPPAPSAEVTQALRPIEGAVKPVRTALLLPAVILCLLVVGGVLIGLALNQRSVSTVVTVNAREGAPPPLPKTVVDEVPAQQLQPSPSSKPKEMASISVADTPQPTVTPTPAAASAVATNAGTETAAVQQETVAAIPPKPAVPVVRGIFFNPTRPSAVLNSKTVFVGDMVAGFRVMTITRDTVTVESEGATNVLTLPE